MLNIYEIAQQYTVSANKYYKQSVYSFDISFLLIKIYIDKFSNLIDLCVYIYQTVVFER